MAAKSCSEIHLKCFNIGNDISLVLFISLSSANEIQQLMLLLYRSKKYIPEGAEPSAAEPIPR